MKSKKPQSTLVRQQTEVASFGSFKRKFHNKTLEQCPYQLEEKKTKPPNHT